MEIDWSKLTYEEKLVENLKVLKSLYKAYQNAIEKDKLNTYGFDVRIPEPDDNNTLFNTNRGLFSTAWVKFKEISFADIEPRFVGSFPTRKISHLQINGIHPMFDAIIYSYRER